MSVPKTMKAVLLTGHGGPEKLEYRDNWPVPGIRPDEVLVKVGACGVNNTDIWVREGAYGSSDDPDEVASFGDSPMEFPIIQGADIVGSIVAVGSEVDPARVDERVMIDFGIYADNNPETPSHDYIGSGQPGGFAEYVAVPAENAHRVETDLSDAELATFCCAYVTGQHMLNLASVDTGDTVLVTGASGGVGSGVIQLCRVRGAIPYAVTSARKANAVKSIGAEAVIARDQGDLKMAVAAAAGGRDIDVVVDTVAGDMLPDLLEVLRPHGTYVTCGAIGGAIVQIDMRRIYLRHLKLIGATQGTRQDFADVCRYALVGKIKPLLAGTYPLNQLAKAQADFKRKDFVGKLVIAVS